jgi:cytochrome c6
MSTHAKADAAAAEATFKAKCAGCHGTDAKGKEALKTLDLASNAVQNMSDAELTSIITDGKGKMPAYGKSLKPDQVKDWVAYIRSLVKK